MTTAQEFLTRYGVTYEWASDGGSQRDDNGWEHNRYAVTLSYVDVLDKPRVITLPTFRTGLAWTGDLDNADEVLPAYARDMQDAAESFDDWANEYGYDTDSRRAYAAWESCAAIRRDVHDWCESQAMFDMFATITDDES